MELIVANDVDDLGCRAAAAGAERIREVLDRQDRVAVILATGASQFVMLDRLVAEAGIDWTRVDCFHLDEYIGIAADHPASFRKYLRERFVERLPQPIGSFEYIDGETDPETELARLAQRISARTIDVAFVGIGENGHLAFNDPPADFRTEAPYLVVDLDEACRRQQLGEGWFPNLESVPSKAISMSIRQIMKSRSIICSVPDARKAVAVRGALEGPVSPECPASILQRHDDTRVFLEPASASLLASR